MKMLSRNNTDANVANISKRAKVRMLHHFKLPIGDVDLLPAMPQVGSSFQRIGKIREREKYKKGSQRQSIGLIVSLNFCLLFDE